MTNTYTKKIVLSALFAALTCVATMIIQVPTPTGGYIHLGDGFVLLSGILLGPALGGISAGIGSMFADVLSGYMQWAPATLIIKAVAAMTGGLLYKLLIKQFSPKNKSLIIILSGIGSGLTVILGYLSYNTLLLGNGFVAAVTSVPTDTLQSVFGILVATFLVPVLRKIPFMKEYW